MPSSDAADMTPPTHAPSVPADGPSTAGPWQDVTLSVVDVLRGARRLALLALPAAFGPYVLLWGFPSLTAGAVTPAGVAVVVLGGTGLYLASAVAHELLHAAAMVLFAGIPWRSIRFGLRLREGVAYIHADRAMTVRAYRAVLLLPGLLQGVLPIAAGWVLGSGWVVLYGYVMLVSAAGDVAVLGLLRPFPGGRLVRDHPREVGCRLMDAA